MKKLLFIFISIMGYTQVGINTTNPDPSSIIDIFSTDKGMLIPRISIPNLSNSAPVNSPTTSLLVYNTNTTTGEGFYYWNGTLWTPLNTNVSHWTKTGNNIYNNNSENVGIGTSLPSTKLHVENNSSAGILLDQNFESNSISPLTNSGNANWTVQNTTFQNGTYAARSGAIGDNQSSSISYSVNIPASGGNVSFYYSVSSEVNYDYLRFYIDGVQQNQWSGNISWTLLNKNLTAGNHTLKWEYSKDSSSSSGQDAAFIDDIKITSAAPAALRIVDGNQSSGRVLTSDANGNATWQTLTNSSITDLPTIASVKGMIIPICNNIGVNSTGNFTTSIKGVTTTVTWTVLNKQIKSGSTVINGQTVALAPITAERLQVKYDFSPALPFNPQVIIFNGYNNSGYPDTFIINYSNSSQSSITVNLARTDLYASDTSDCWSGQFYFDVFMTN